VHHFHGHDLQPQTFHALDHLADQAAGDPSGLMMDSVRSITDLSLSWFSPGA